MTANLAAALVSAQADMPKVEPDAVNPHYKTKFVSLDNLIAHTRPVLNKHGLAMVQLPATNDAGLPVLRTILIHGASGEQMSADAPLMLGKNDMQGLGAAITYARRYAWAAALGISEQEDDDGETAAAGRREETHQQGTGASPQGAAPSLSSRPPAAASGKVSKEQHSKIGALIGELRDAQTPVPPDYGDGLDWIEYSRAYARDKFGVESRADLTSKQASELIDHLDSHSLPF